MYKKAILDYQPTDDQEAADKALVIQAIQRCGDEILLRDQLMAHVTASGFVVNATREQVLMVHHNVYDTWAIPGGHCDGDGDLMHVAIKEVQEETGVQARIVGELFGLDVMEVHAHVRRGVYVPTHLHLSAVYFMEADDTAPLTRCPDENSGVQWVPIDEMAGWNNEPHVQPLYNKLAERAKRWQA